jgi:hypothetical protein
MFLHCAAGLGRELVRTMPDRIEVGVAVPGTETVGKRVQARLVDRYRPPP